jgi:hypothetical protein
VWLQVLHNWCWFTTDIIVYKWEKVQTDKQRSTKHTLKANDRVTRTPLKTGGELRCSGKVSSFCSTSGTRRVNLVTNPVISHEEERIYSCWLSCIFVCLISVGIVSYNCNILISGTPIVKSLSYFSGHCKLPPLSKDWKET